MSARPRLKVACRRILWTVLAIAPARAKGRSSASALPTSPPLRRSHPAGSVPRVRRTAAAWRRRWQAPVDVDKVTKACQQTASTKQQAMRLCMNEGGVARVSAGILGPSHTTTCHGTRRAWGAALRDGDGAVKNQAQVKSTLCDSAGDAPAPCEDENDIVDDTPISMTLARVPRTQHTAHSTQHTAHGHRTQSFQMTHR